MTVDMRSFLQQIKKSNDLVTVKKKVSTKYEVAAVTAKLDGSKAALFENINGSKFKLVSNLVGSRDRFAQAIGCKNKLFLLWVRIDGRHNSPMIVWAIWRALSKF